MGLFNRLFRRRNPQDTLIDWGLGITNEMERAYRNQLELTPAQGVPRGVGVLKVRLFATTFVHTAYLVGCGPSEAEAVEAFQVCSGIAMRPFSQPDYTPTITREEAMSFGSDFMLKASRLIRAELETGPSTLESRTDAFKHLVGMYHHCLAESCPSGTYTQPVRCELDLLAEGAIWSTLRAMSNQIAEFQN